MATTTNAKSKKSAEIPADAHPLWKGPTKTFPEYAKHWASLTKVELAVMWTIVSGITIQVFGDHGIAKTAAVCGQASAIARMLGFEGVTVVMIPAATIGPDDLISAAPVKKDGETILVELITSQVRPGQPFVLVVDDPLMSPPIMANQYMQLKDKWRLGGFDLRAAGCIGVVFIDNPSLAETNTVIEDLAQADRVMHMSVSDVDTAQSVKMFMANKYPDMDLNAAFAARESLPKELRYILSWRTFEQMVEIMLAGFPGHWALPYVDGSYSWLAITDSSGKTVDRTKETISKIAAALGVPYIESISNPVPKALKAATEHGWSIRIVGPHGIGKTEMTRQVIVEELGLGLVDFSLPVTDFDTLISPVPTADGDLKMIMAERLIAPGDKVVFIDEASRAKDLLAYARGNELIHEHALGGIKIPDLKAVVAAENPPEFLGRKYDVSQGTIAHADRYEMTIVIDSSDVPFYEWLKNELPAKLAKFNPTLYASRVDEIASVAETVCDWHREDLDNDGRAWISPRNLERMIVAYLNGIPLEATKIWLGEGEVAPVPLSLLEARLSGRARTGLREIASAIDVWEAKLQADSEVGDVGLESTDVVHSALSNADTDTLWQYADQVVTLVKYLPPRFRVTYLDSRDADRQKFWIAAMGCASGRLTAKDLEKAKEARSK